MDQRYAVSLHVAIETSALYLAFSGWAESPSSSCTFVSPEAIIFTSVAVLLIALLAAFEWHGNRVPRRRREGEKVVAWQEHKGKVRTFKRPKPPGISVSATLPSSSSSSSSSSPSGASSVASPPSFASSTSS